MIEVNKIAIPFAQSGNKSKIYDTRQPEQAENEATWSTGFPPITMIRKEDGGLPPTGLDFNGIFYDISSNVVFACMGGRYKFDPEYAEKIGGYPKGAILLNDDENKQYISNIANNKIDFNTADPAKLTQWSVISIADIDKVIDSKISNADFSQALNQKANTSTNINAGNGLTGGGNLTTSRTIELGTPTAITQSSTNSVTTTSHTHSISKATTAQQGIVQLSSALTDREDLASTPKAVNTVNKAVTTAQSTANTAVTKADNAQARADSAYSLANSKQDKLTFVGSGDVVRQSFTAQFFGGNQNIVDVTSSRAKDTTYTNNLLRPIFVSAKVEGDRPVCFFEVNGVKFGYGHSGYSENSTTGATAIVPAGAKYRLTTAGLVTLEWWSEIR